MAELLTVGNLLTLLMLVFLQAVLGFDNLLYISIESKRVPEDKQGFVRKMGIGLAILLRIILLFAVVHMIDAFQAPFTEFNFELFDAHFHGDFNVHSIIVLGGGLFILYTAVKEISHMLSIEDLEHGVEEQTPKSTGAAIAMICLMNLVFSFDSILSAIALTDSFAIMATAIIISGVMMIVLADAVANFLKKNRMYEVLGLFILFLVGVMLLSEGAHLAHLKLFDSEIHAMSKATFYFSIGALVIVEIAQSRYQKKLAREREREAHDGDPEYADRAAAAAEAAAQEAEALAEAAADEEADGSIES